MRKIFTGSLAMAMAAAMAATPAAAQEAGEWEFTFQPYIMVPAMNGDAAVRGIDAEVDVGRKDVVKNLNIGFLGYVEAHNGAIGFGVDTNYMNLDANEDDALVAANVSQTAVQPMIFYRVAPQLDLLVGARYNAIKLTTESNVEILDGVSRKADWIDPIVGVRFRAPVSDSIDVGLLANVGGFGVGSDIAVQIRPMVNFGVAENITIDAGYQLIYMDYEKGSDDRRFAYDVTTDGPIIGATFKF
jgi:opacity protein-like surface antigen